MTGKASVPIAVEDERGGSFVIRVAGTDRFGNPVVADRDLTISGRDDETKLRLLADRLDFKVGETAKVNLHGRDAAGPLQVSVEFPDGRREQVESSVTRRDGPRSTASALAR